MAKTTGYWLMKSEPDVYPFEKLIKDKRTRWDGVRNFEARNHLRAMQKGDLCLFYHSNIGKEVVGVMEVMKTAYADPTAEEGDWSVVDVGPVKALTEPVTLATIKADKALTEIQLLKRSRLSVVPLSKTHFERILKLGKTQL
jgi:predicted RNA-binding protein with PUA-like domain